MRSILLLIFSVLIAAATATAQIELVSGDYFPAEFEFTELQKITSQESFEDSTRLSKVQDGGLFADVGFVKYAKRIYSAVNNGSLSIEIVTLLDARAAYSAMTLLRTGGIQDGPPGDAYAPIAGGLCFSQGKTWVGVKPTGVSDDLVKRVAVSISNRIGARRQRPPSLVTHLPRTGLDRSTLRYYPSVKTFDAYSHKTGGPPLHVETDAEIAQAQYTLNGRTGTLSLLSFPTKEMAEEYFDQLSKAQQKPGPKSYTKRAGPIIGILQGQFDTGSADKILSSIQYSYSVKWVQEKDKKTVWGVPVGILSTVVKSLFFVVLLFGVSIFVGIGYAVFRVIMKRRMSKRSPDDQDPDEMTRLKMR